MAKEKKEKKSKKEKKDKGEAGAADADEGATLIITLLQSRPPRSVSADNRSFLSRFSLCMV